MKPKFESGSGNENKAEKIPSREEVIVELKKHILNYSPDAEPKIPEERNDSLGLASLEMEIKDPNSDGYVVFAYQRKRDSDERGRNGSLETLIEYYALDKNREVEGFGGGTTIARLINGQWVEATRAGWRQTH